MWVSAAKRPKILGWTSSPSLGRLRSHPRLTESEAIAGVEALLRKQAAADRFSGAALVAKDGELRFADAYGRRIANEGSRTRSRRASASAR